MTVIVLTFKLIFCLNFNFNVIFCYVISQSLLIEIMENKLCLFPSLKLDADHETKHRPNKRKKEALPEGP